MKVRYFIKKGKEGLITSNSLQIAPSSILVVSQDPLFNLIQNTGNASQLMEPEFIIVWLFFFLVEQLCSVGI